jgi:hypothetical protein
MKRFFYVWMVLGILMSQTNLYSRENKQEINPCLFNAMEQAVRMYRNQEKVGQNRKYMIIRMKLMKISPISGEFVLSHIHTDWDYNDLQPTHYIRVNNEIILVKVDISCKCNPEDFGISSITEASKQEALDILAGPNMAITGQPSPYMIFKYKKEKLKSRFYFVPPIPPKRYRF